MDWPELFHLMHNPQKSRKNVVRVLYCWILCIESHTRPYYWRHLLHGMIDSQGEVPGLLEELASVKKQASSSVEEALPEMSSDLLEALERLTLRTLWAFFSLRMDGAIFSGHERGYEKAMKFFFLAHGRGFPCEEEVREEWENLLPVLQRIKEQARKDSEEP